MNAAAGAIGGIGLLIVGILFIVLAIFWILFPILVYSRLGDIRDELKKANEKSGLAEHIANKRLKELEKQTAWSERGDALLTHIEKNTRAKTEDEVPA